MTNPGLKMSHDGADRVRHFQTKVSQLVEELLLHHLRAGSIKNDDDDPSMRGYISSPGRRCFLGVSVAVFTTIFTVVLTYVISTQSCPWVHFV